MIAFTQSASGGCMSYQDDQGRFLGLMHQPFPNLHGTMQPAETQLPSKAM